jgi:Icc-related predicted phosphoesterase
MKIVVMSCIHNDVESILNFYEKLAELKFDIIISPGDFTDSVFPKGFTRVDIGRVIIEELKTFGKPVLVVPGSWDKDLIKMFEHEDISIHGKGKIIHGIGFYGFGGAKTPFGLPFEPEDIEIEVGLEKSYKDVLNSEFKVQVTHSPPKDTRLDIITAGVHVGSNVVRKFIESKQPDVAVCSHIHEAKGVDSIKNTKIINSGRFPEGYCGLIELERGKVDVKIINLI